VTLEVDNQTVRKQQLEKLVKIKASRDNDKVKKCLEELTRIAKEENGNLLEAAVTAAKERATLGEISDALEVVYGRHKAKIQSFSGVYSKEMKTDKSFHKAKALADELQKRKVADLEL